jgi:hypothetical protein
VKQCHLQLCDQKWLTTSMLFADFSSYINEINTKLQCRGKTVKSLVNTLYALEGKRKILSKCNVNTQAL